MISTGSRAQVMHGTAMKTSGGLTKSQLTYNKQGKIVSKKASALAKKNNRLVNAGYVTRKGEFGISGNMRGGSDYNLLKNKLDIENFKKKRITEYCIPYKNICPSFMWKNNTNNILTINKSTGNVDCKEINGVNQSSVYKKIDVDNEYRLYLNGNTLILKFKTN